MAERSADQAAGLRRLFARAPAPVVLLLGVCDERPMARLAARCVEVAARSGRQLAFSRWLPGGATAAQLHALRVANDAVLVHAAAGAAPVALLESPQLAARAWLVTAVDDVAITETYAFVKRRAVMFAGLELGVLALGGRERAAAQARVANLAGLARDQLGLELRCIGWLSDAALQGVGAADRGAERRQTERAWRGVLREIAGHDAASPGPPGIAPSGALRGPPGALRHAGLRTP